MLSDFLRGLHIMGRFKMMCGTEMERKLGQIEQYTKDNGKIINHMVSASSPIPPETTTRENGFTLKLRDKECFVREMEIATEDTGKMMNLQVTVLKKL